MNSKEVIRRMMEGFTLHTTFSKAAQAATAHKTARDAPLA